MRQVQKGTRRISPSHPPPPPGCPAYPPHPSSSPLSPLHYHHPPSYLHHPPFCPPPLGALEGLQALPPLQQRTIGQASSPRLTKI